MKRKIGKLKYYVLLYFLVWRKKKETVKYNTPIFPFFFFYRKTDYIDTERMKFTLWTYFSETEPDSRKFMLKLALTWICTESQQWNADEDSKWLKLDTLSFSSHRRQSRRIKRTVIAVEPIKIFLLAFLCLNYSIFLFSVARLIWLMKQLKK